MYYSLVPNKTKRTHWGCKLNYFEVENALLRLPERTSIGRGTNQKPPQWDFSTNGWWFTPELPATTVATVLTYLETSSVLLSVLNWFSRAWVLSGRCEVILQPGWAQQALSSGWVLSPCSWRDVRGNQRSSGHLELLQHVELDLWPLFHWSLVV